MADEYTTEPQPKIADIQPLTMAYVALSGLILGFIAWGLTALISNYVIDPLFCRTDSANFSVCAQGGSLASNVALIFASGFGLLALVRLGIFRPLLVALASAITLWGLGTWVGGMEWYVALLWSGVLFALAYATYTWLSQIRSFVIALIAIIVVIAVARIVPIL